MTEQTRESSAAASSRSRREGTPDEIAKASPSSSPDDRPTLAGRRARRSTAVPDRPVTVPPPSGALRNFPRDPGVLHSLAGPGAQRKGRRGRRIREQETHHVAAARGLAGALALIALLTLPATAARASRPPQTRPSYPRPLRRTPCRHGDSRADRGAARLAAAVAACGSDPHLEGGCTSPADRAIRATPTAARPRRLHRRGPLSPPRHPTPCGHAHIDPRADACAHAPRLVPTGATPLATGTGDGPAGRPLRAR